MIRPGMCIKAANEFNSNFHFHAKIAQCNKLTTDQNLSDIH